MNFKDGKVIMKESQTKNMNLKIIPEKTKLCSEKVESLKVNYKRI